MFENDYNITGKHATYLKFLAAKNAGAKDADESGPTAAKIFERYIDVYMNAAIWDCSMIVPPQKIQHPMTERAFMQMHMLKSAKTVFSCTG